MKEAWPRQDPASMNAFYGNPDLHHDGRPDPDWERQNLVHVVPPFRMLIAWDVSKTVSTISVHRKCAASLDRILKRIAESFTTAEAEQYQINRFGGTYLFRMERGAPRLSIHSWAAAIDLSPAINAFGREYGSRPNMMPMKAVQIFKDEGWVWGSSFPTPDCMHFQAAL
jgi:hypothetical protein